MDLRQALAHHQREQSTKPRVKADSARAPLIEIFHSVQGEGRFAGVPMAFVRTATCPLRCLYCDTPNSYQAPATAPVNFGARTQQEPNPVAAERAAELVRQLCNAKAAGQSAPRVSVTGGEPLVFPQFVREFGRAVRERGMRLQLETAAIDPEALAACVDQIDHVSADYKLPETLGAPERKELLLGAGQSYGQRHRQCCEIAIRRGATVDVKIVLTDRVSDASLEGALDELGPIRDKVLLVLQPVTPFGAVQGRLPARDLERFVATSLRHQFDVRVLPQLHKTLRLP